MAMAFILYTQIQANPVELSPSVSNLAASAPSLSSDTTQAFENSTNNNTTDAHLFDNNAPQPTPEDNHTKAKVIGLVIIFIFLVVGLTACYCCWKHKKTIMKGAMYVI
jgi:hypothetical protein